MCCYFHNVKGNFKLIMGRKKRVNGPHSFISLEPILYYNTSSWHLNFLWLILSDHYYVHQMPISRNDWLVLRAPLCKTDGFNHVAPNWCRIDDKALWKLGPNRHFLVIVSNQMGTLSCLPICNFAVMGFIVNLMRKTIWNAVDLNTNAISIVIWDKTQCMWHKVD